MKARVLYVLLITYFCCLLFGQQSFATVLFSDNLENQRLWNGCPNDRFKNNVDGWSGYWATWSCGTLSIVDDGGNHGKVWKFVWPQAMASLGPAVPTTVTGGRSSVYIGFWWRHDAGWNWGKDNTHKWVYLPVAGDRLMLSFVYGTLAFFNNGNYNLHVTNHPNTTATAWLDDRAWHKYVIFASPGTGEIRVWYDDTECTWKGNNLNVNWKGSTFGSSHDHELVIGYQSRPNWGSGNTSYFDGVIVATTKEEVDTFLGSVDSQNR